MKNWFGGLTKRRAIRSYARRLPLILRRDYGASSAYTPAQIRRAIERSGLSTSYGCYALLMFSDRAVFDEYHRDMGEHCDYGAMRHEVAHTLFNGNADFTVSDIFGLSAAGSEAADHVSHHDGVVGHHGGHVH